jgi:rare lipoprotein A
LTLSAQGLNLISRLHGFFWWGHRMRKLGEIAGGLLLFTACGALAAQVTRVSEPSATPISLPLLAQAPAPASPAPAPALATRDASTGKAAYYGKKFQGRKTASGEPFDMNKLTAASNDHHPFGTKLKVTHVANGKSVEVRVNDRLTGGDRIIDLSYAAAQQIGMVKAGVAEVKVEVSAPAAETKKR